MPYVCGEPLPPEKVYDDGISEADGAVAFGLLHFSWKPIDNIVEVIGSDRRGVLFSGAWLHDPYRHSLCSGAAIRRLRIYLL
jgi:hypothetical protein